MVSVTSVAVSVVPVPSTFTLRALRERTTQYTKKQKHTAPSKPPPVTNAKSYAWAPKIPAKCRHAG